MSSDEDMYKFDTAQTVCYIIILFAFFNGISNSFSSL
jgi:hypothetical protein